MGDMHTPESGGPGKSDKVWTTADIPGLEGASFDPERFQSYSDQELEQLAQIAFHNGDFHEALDIARELDRQRLERMPRVDLRRVDYLNMIVQANRAINGSAQESINALQEVIYIQEQLNSGDSRKLARDFMKLGEAFAQSGEHIKANASYQRAINLYNSDGLTGLYPTREALVHAIHAYDIDDAAQASTMTFKAFQSYFNQSVENRARLFGMLEAVGSKSLQSGRHQDAEQVLIEIVRLAEYLYEHPDSRSHLQPGAQAKLETGQYYNQLATAQFGLEKFDDCLATMNKALHYLDSRFKSSIPQIVLEYRVNIAHVMERAGKTEEREKMIREIAELSEELLGDDSDQRAYYIGMKANALLQSHKLSEAQETVQRALELAGEDPLSRANCLATRGGLSLANNQIEEGERDFLEALSIYERLKDQVPRRALFDMHIQLGILYAQTGRMAEAEGRVEKISELIKTEVCSGPYFTASHYWVRAFLRLAASSSDYDRIEKELEKAESFNQKVSEGSGPITDHILMAQAQCFAGRAELYGSEGDFHKAIEKLEELKTYLERKGETGRPIAVEALRQLAALHKKIGNDEIAGQYQRKYESEKFSLDWVSGKDPFQGGSDLPSDFE